MSARCLPCTPTHPSTPGSRKALTEDRIDGIVGDIRPALRRQDYDAAVERAAVDIGLALAGGKPSGAGGARQQGGRCLTVGLPWMLHIVS